MNNKKLVIVIAVLIIAVGILAYFNQSIISSKNQSRENPALVVKFKGEEKGSITLEKIKTLGEEEFEKTLRSSGKPPRDHVYKGVALSKILKTVDKGILKQGEQVIIKAIDGYVSAFSIDEVLDKENIYLVYLQDGKPLKSKKDGGSGPMMVVVRKDEFGQRWCKFAVEVDVQ